jgi:hypothetical protein
VASDAVCCGVLVIRKKAQASAKRIAGQAEPENLHERSLPTDGVADGPKNWLRFKATTSVSEFCSFIHSEGFAAYLKGNSNSNSLPLSNALGRTA